MVIVDTAGRLAVDEAMMQEITAIKPSGLGAEITATAVLAEVEGRKLTFNVGARDAEGLIGEGIHIRYIVDREKFMAKVK